MVKEYLNYRSIEELLSENPEHVPVEVRGVPSFVTWNDDSVSAFLNEGSYGVHIAVKMHGKNGAEFMAECFQKAANRAESVIIKGNYLSSATLTKNKIIFAEQIGLPGDLGLHQAQGNF